jgi:tetratricopeptide (TPR) repeat protein
MCVKPQTPAEAETYRIIERTTARLQAGETTPHIYLERGRAYKQVAHLEEAIADLTCALEGRPSLALEDRALAFNLRGMAYRRLGQYAQAIADTSRSVELQPTYAPYWADRGWARTCGGLAEQALPDFARCIELHPYFLAYIYRGITHFVMGNYPAALADYDQVIQLYPGDIAFNSYLNRAILRLMVHGDTRGAEADLDIAIERNPDAIHPSPRPYTYRGLARALEGRTVEALADLETGQQLGDDLMIHLARGYIHYCNGEEQALQRELACFIHHSQQMGWDMGANLQAAAGFIRNPVSAIPRLIPLIA